MAFRSWRLIPSPNRLILQATLLALQLSAFTALRSLASRCPMISITSLLSEVLRISIARTDSCSATRGLYPNRRTATDSYPGGPSPVSRRSSPDSHSVFTTVPPAHSSGQQLPSPQVTLHQGRR